MRHTAPWILAIVASTLFGVVAAVVLLRELPDPVEESVRRAAEINQEAAFEYVYERDTGHRELLDATIKAMNDRPAKYRPTPEQVNAYRDRWRESYRAKWLRERHPSGAGSR